MISYIIFNGFKNALRFVQQKKIHKFFIFYNILS
jgi:hypothetical protein